MAQRVLEECIPICGTTRCCHLHQPIVLASVCLGEVWGSLIPVEFKPRKPQKVVVDGVEKEKTSLLKPRGLRWPGEAREPLSTVIDAEKSYNFRPYAYTTQGVTPNLFYAQSSGEISFMPRASVPTGAHFHLALIMLILLPSKLKSGESMMTYSPQWMLR